MTPASHQGPTGSSPRAGQPFRWSTIRRIFPADRSIESGSITMTDTDTPIRSLIRAPS